MFQITMTLIKANLIKNDCGSTPPKNYRASGLRQRMNLENDFRTTKMQIIAPVAP